MVIGRFSIFLVRLIPRLARKPPRPVPVWSFPPDELNRVLATAIIAPMTTVRRGWSTRVKVTFQNKTGEIALDQIRAVDKSRFVKRPGDLDSETAHAVLDTLGELFAP